MALFDRNFKEIISSQVLSILGGLLAGTILAAYTDKLLFLPGMFIILPGFLEMRGNISGTLSSRISSGLFLGVINPKRVHSKIIRGNVMASFVLALVVSCALGLLALLFNYLTFHEFTPKIVLLPILAGAVANLIEVPLALFLTLALFREGHDPNNIMGPLLTSTGDITSIFSLLLVLVIL